MSLFTKLFSQQEGRDPESSGSSAFHRSMGKAGVEKAYPLLKHPEPK